MTMEFSVWTTTTSTSTETCRMIQARPDNNGKYNSKVGHYIPLHPEKYKGSAGLMYKSDLERLMMLYLDKNPNVVSWTYEPFSIKYNDASSGGKQRKYYIDFAAVIKSGNFLKTVWIEVKSKRETHEPKNKNNIREMQTWVKNQSKWAAAIKSAKERGHEFMVITEDQLH